MDIEQRRLITPHNRVLSVAPPEQIPTLWREVGTPPCHAPTQGRTLEARGWRLLFPSLPHTASISRKRVNTGDPKLSLLNLRGYRKHMIGSPEWKARGQLECYILLPLTSLISETNSSWGIILNSEGNNCRHNYFVHKISYILLFNHFVMQQKIWWGRQSPNPLTEWPDSGRSFSALLMARWHAMR